MASSSSESPTTPGFTSKRERYRWEILNPDIIHYISGFEYNPDMALVFNGDIDLSTVTGITINFQVVMESINKNNLKVLEKLFRLKSLISLVFRPYDDDLMDEIKYYYVIHKILVNNSETLRYLDMGCLHVEDDIILCKNLKQFEFSKRSHFSRQVICVCEILSSIRGCITPFQNINIPSKIYIDANIRKNELSELGSARLSADLSSGVDYGEMSSVYQYLWHHPEDRIKFKANAKDKHFVTNSWWELSEDGTLIRKEGELGDADDEWYFETPPEITDAHRYEPTPPFLFIPEGMPQSTIVDFSESKRFFQNLDRTVELEMMRLLLKSYPDSEDRKIIEARIEARIEKDLVLSMGMIHHRNLFPLYRNLMKAGSKVRCFRKMPERPEFKNNFKQYFRTHFSKGKFRTASPIFLYLPQKYDVIVCSKNSLTKTEIIRLAGKCQKLYVDIDDFGGPENVFFISKPVIGFGYIADGDKIIYRWD